jgi:hypothetical protein
MPELTSPISPAFQDRILALLSPLFLEAPGGNMAAARETVRTTLDGYNPRTEEELRLAALTVAFGIAALEALGDAADPGLPVNQRLRLRNNASALSRAGHRTQAALDKMHRGDAQPTTLQPPTLPASAETQDLLVFARTLVPTRNTSTTPLARQRSELQSGHRTTTH